MREDQGSQIRIFIADTGEEIASGISEMKLTPSADQPEQEGTVRYWLIDKVTGFKPEGIDLMNEFNYMQSLENAIKLAKECEERNHHDVEIWRETRHGRNEKVIWK